MYFIIRWRTTLQYQKGKILPHLITQKDKVLFPVQLKKKSIYTTLNSEGIFLI